ncbi:MAG: calcium-binding protein [Granulosicoccus sp.]
MNTQTTLAVTSSCLILFSLLNPALATEKRHYNKHRDINLIQGLDNNSSRNPFVQPQDSALSGGGRDQSLEFGDVLFGTWQDDVINGRLGPDVIVGGGRDDVLLGGVEHFTANNRDRAFGGAGSDMFIWKPGDGSDFFDGGRGQDAVVFGVTGELDDGEAKFQVVNNGQAGVLFIDPDTQLPKVDVTNSPGFCEIIDAGSTVDAAEELAQLGIDHLVRFSIRGVRDAFEAGSQSNDNGVRVTLHLKDVEVLVCTSRHGGEIEVFDLTVTPAKPISSRHLRHRLKKRLEDIVF